MEELAVKKAGLVNEADFEATVIEVSPAANATIQPEPPQSVPENVSSLAADEQEQKLQQPKWVGRVLGHFKLLRLLGEGAMGRVIQAQDIHLGRIVALKVLRKQIHGLQETNCVKQFLREAQAAARIEHPNVIPIYEINQYDGWWYIAMEMLEGGSLDTVIKAAGPLPPERACPIIADAAAGLAAAHQVGIIHRDIKPSNLLLSRGGRCKLADFGLVRLNDPNDPFDLQVAVGTPYYVAPEIIQHQAPTPAIDVYSLGVTLYCALTGSPPFQAKTRREVLDLHISAPPPNVRDQVPSCPETLARLVRRAMTKDPAQRPTASDFSYALRSESIGMERSQGHPLSAGSGSWIATSDQVIPLSGDPRSGSGFLSGSTATLPSAQTTTTLPRSKIMQVTKWIGGGLVMVSVVFLISFLAGRMGAANKPAMILPNPSEVPPPSPIIYQASDIYRLLGELRERFSDAPDSYGLLAADQSPARRELNVGHLAFSWVGKVDTNGVRFVASKKGPHYFPIDSRLAPLIRVEEYAGYPTSQAAEADDKIPWP